MNSPESTNQLAVFDSMLDRLAESAVRPGVTATSFFEELHRVIDVVINCESIAIAAIGPDNRLLHVYGNPSLTEHLHLSPVEEQGQESSVAFNAEISTVQPTALTLLSKHWGWLLTQVESDAMRPIHRQFLEGIGEIVGEYLKTRSLASQQAVATAESSFLNNIHRSLDVNEVANHIANDARLLLGCERVSVFARRANRHIVKAISGVSQIERRTELMRSQHQLIQLAAKLDGPLGSDRPPSEKRLVSIMEQYQQISGFPFLFGIPLQHRSGMIGYLLVESEEGVDRVEFARNIVLVATQAGLALGNAVQHQSIPAPIRAMGWVASRTNMTRTTVLFLLTGLMALFCCYYKTEFKIRLEGMLRPAVERTVFAPRDGVVDRVLVRQGQRVEVGQVLILLRSPEIELELTRIAGRQARLNKQLDAKNIALNQSTSDPNASAALIGQLTSEIADIEFELASLDDDKSYLLEQEAELQIVSPVTGEVLTWNVEEDLRERPVRWGDELLIIADERGRWDLEIRIPDRKYGYLIGNNQTLVGTPVRYFLMSDPDRVFTTAVEQTGLVTETDPQLGSFLPAQCPVNEEGLAKRHGARVIADLDAGRRSIGYVWTCELVDSIRRRWVW